MTGRARNLTRELEASGPYDPDDMSVADARKVLRKAYAALGFKGLPRLLTLPESQHKLGMSARRAVGLTLAPADMSGEYDACTWRTAACTAVCVLATAGKSVFPSVIRGRTAKTKVLGQEPQAFVTLLAHELRAQVTAHGPIDFRPNVASDLRWESICPRLFELDGVRVYDYTKAPRAQRALGQKTYDKLVFSLSEAGHSQGEALKWLRSGGNVAVVFDTKRGHALPTTFAGFDVVDADTSDSRVDDPDGVVVGLRAKGAARGLVGTADGFIRKGEAT
jgi:hypothetical protein